MRADQNSDACETAPAARKRRRLRDLILVGLGQSAAAIGAIVGVRMLTRAFPPASYGESALLMTMAALALQLVLFPLSGGVLRFFSPAQQQKQVGAFMRAVIRIFGWTTLAMIALALIAALLLLAIGWTRWLGALAALLAYTLAFGWGSALDGIQNAAQQRAVVAFHQGAVQWLRPLLAIALIPLLGNSGTVILAGWAAASVLVLVSQLLFLRPLLQRESASEERVNTDAIKRWSATILSYSLPFMLWAVFTWAQVASDRWALETFRTRVDVGLYTAVFQLGYAPMMLLSTIAFQFVSPILFARAGDGSDRTRVHNAYQLNARLPLVFLLGTVILASVSFLLHAPACALVLGAEYRSASYLLPWMVLAGGIYAAAQLATLGILSSGETRRLIAPKVVTAFIGILLVTLGARRFGIEGVVGGLIAFSCSCFAWNFLLLRQYRTNGDVPSQPSTAGAHE